MKLRAAAFWFLLEACASSQPSPKSPQPTAAAGKETPAERFRRDAKRRQAEDDDRRRREEFMQRNNAHVR
jgi:hypothetical protein